MTEFPVCFTDCYRQSLLCLIWDTWGFSLHFPFLRIASSQPHLHNFLFFWGFTVFTVVPIPLCSQLPVLTLRHTTLSHMKIWILINPNLPSGRILQYTSHLCWFKNRLFILPERDYISPSIALNIPDLIPHIHVLLFASFLFSVYWIFGRCYGDWPCVFLHGVFVCKRLMALCQPEACRGIIARQSFCTSHYHRFNLWPPRSKLTRAS